MEQYLEAIPDFQKAIKFESTNSEYYYLLGMCKAKLNRHEEATIDFNKAIHLEQRIGDYYRSRGMCRISLGQNDEACEDFHKALELHAFNSQFLVKKYCGGED